ncbi:HNH/endonuclease VII fold putative polymorphic toxin [Cobetia sp. QF-1]|uniref:HNH/endonuclease VII fold putative polymorphic toxin n=1 Tax=Cobetia sp. QF-1 TaxID=1969833 RepID=UPI0034E8B8DD
MNDDGSPVMTREYHYNTNNGDPVIIQEHSLEHEEAVPLRGAEPHFNLRPSDNPTTGSVMNSHGHYYF